MKLKHKSKIEKIRGKGAYTSGSCEKRVYRAQKILREEKKTKSFLKCFLRLKNFKSLAGIS